MKRRSRERFLRIPSAHSQACNVVHDGVLCQGCHARFPFPQALKSTPRHCLVFLEVCFQEILPSDAPFLPRKYVWKLGATLASGVFVVGLNEFAWVGFVAPILELENRFWEY